VRAVITGRKTKQEFIEIGRDVRKQFAQVGYPVWKHHRHVFPAQRPPEARILRRPEPNVMRGMPALSNDLKEDVAQAEQVVFGMAGLVIEVDPYMATRLFMDQDVVRPDVPVMQPDLTEPGYRLDTADKPLHLP
jgi:hypothetical protein